LEVIALLGNRHALLEQRRSLTAPEPSPQDAAAKEETKPFASRLTARWA
jgi:hypothetical protein